jgi:hypothetical protein
MGGFVVIITPSKWGNYHDARHLPLLFAASGCLFAGPNPRMVYITGPKRIAAVEEFAFNG